MPLSEIRNKKKWEETFVGNRSNRGRKTIQ